MLRLNGAVVRTKVFLNRLKYTMDFSHSFLSYGNLSVMYSSDIPSYRKISLNLYLNGV